MALNAYLKIKGAKTGIVKGSVTQKGREGKIMVIASTHEVYQPADTATGLSTGKRMHKPFIIMKELDKSTPVLHTMLVNNENITEWELQFWTPSNKTGTGAGTEIQHYTVKLKNARIIDINFRMLNNKNPELAKYAEQEEIAFTYEKIEWIWNDGGITAQDDWEAPVV
jgi:type VI secretion system secreted protein Hcp